MAAAGWLLNLGFAGGSIASKADPAVTIPWDALFRDVFRVVPEGSNPVMIRRNFERLNNAMNRLFALYTENVVFNIQVGNIDIPTDDGKITFGAAGQPDGDASIGFNGFNLVFNMATPGDFVFSDGWVGIGISPTVAGLEIARGDIQLVLRHDIRTKYCYFTVDVNHDLTLMPSSTGGVIVKPTTSSANSFDVQQANGTSVFAVNTSTPGMKLSYDADSFATFAVDASDTLTIKPAAAGGVVFQPTTTDSTTFFQVLDADGGTPILNVDSVNERVGFGVADPDFKVEIFGGLSLLKLSFDADSFATFKVSATDNLTITTSSSGSVKFQPTTDSVGFFQVLDANSGLPVLSVDTINERVAIGIVTPLAKHHVQATTEQLRLSYNTTNYASFTVASNGSLSLTTVDAAAAAADIDIAPDGVTTIGDGGTTDYLEISAAGLPTLHNGQELRFNDTGDSNYVGFKAPALTGNQIWTLPATDGNPGAVLATDGSGNTSWMDNASEKTWAFMSRDANSGTNYIGGFYKFGSTDNDFNPSITFGTADVSYAAHFFLVQAAGASGGTDTVIRITGTTIDDQGNRATGVNVDLTVDDAGAAGTYYETSEKWLGQITIVKLSGPDLLCNYGFAKYWDNNNTNFKVVGIEATWLGAKNDNSPDIHLHHHRPTGWTYNAGAEPTTPTEIASMNGDHVTEIKIAADQEGAWKRDNLSTDINGSADEGTILELTTTTNRTYAIGNFLVRITPQ